MDMRPALLASAILDTLPRSMHQLRLDLRSLRGKELTVPQFRILIQISKGNNSITEIARHQGVSQPGMSKMIEALVRRGLITRKKDAVDKRSRPLSLTPKGERLLAGTKARASENLSRKVAKRLTDHDRGDLERGLKALQKLFLAIGILVSAAGAGGGTAHASPSSALRWDDCVKEAAASNPEIWSAEQTLKGAEYQTSGAYSGFLPQIGTQFNYSYGTSSTGSLTTAGSGATTTATSLGVGAASNAADSYYSVSASVSESLFSGLSDRAKVLQASANADVVRANLGTVRARVSYDLKSAFASLKYADDSDELTQDIIRRREENLRLVSLRFDSGRENKGSVLLSKAYLEQSKLDHLQALDGISVAQAQLARVLGRDETEQIAITGDVPMRSPGTPVDFRLAALATPDYRQAAAQERAADAGITVARAPFYPNLNVTGTTGRTGMDWFPQNSRWSIGLGLTFSLFNGGKDYYATKNAVATHNATELTEHNTLRATVAKLKQTWTAYVEAVQKVKVDESFRAAALLRAEIGRSKYNNGLLSFEDWDLIENDLITREKALLQSRRDRVIAEAAWEQAMGKGALQK